MSDETDPMLGDEDTQKAYVEAVTTIMQDAIEETRAARRVPTNRDDSEPVMLGNQGFTGGISSA